MKIQTINNLFPILLILLIYSCSIQNKKSKILFITTNINEMNNEPNGTYLIELSTPFNEFLNKGFEIDIVSPNGGNIPIYHSGNISPETKSIIENNVYKHKTENSLKPSEVEPEEYLAVIIPGGYGQFWDTHQNNDILQIISKIHDSEGIIGTIGHGTATLINVKLNSGEYLVKGKTMTSFPTWNETNIMKQSDFGKLLPYDMEKVLLKRGANLKVYNHEKKINYEIVDAKNNLVTASFSSSGKFLASEVLKLINKIK